MILFSVFLACKAPPTVNDGGTEGVQAYAANGQQGVSTQGGTSLFRFRVDSSIHCWTMNSMHMLVKIQF